MRVLEQVGRIANVEVVAEEPQPGRIVIEIKARDTATGKAIAVKHRILLKKSARRSIATLTQLDTDWLTFCDARLYPVAAR